MMYTLGISLEGKELKIALVNKQGKKIGIELVHSFSLHGDTSSLEPLKQLAPFLVGKSVKIISSLAASEVILRDLLLPMTNERKILAILPFQAETLIPFPPEETVLHSYILKKSRKQSHVFLTATRKEKISTHLHILHALGIEPHQISTSVHALARWTNLTLPSSSESYKKIAYLTQGESFFLLMHNNQILSSKTLSLAASSLERELAKADEFLRTKFPEANESSWLLTGSLASQAAKIPPTNISSTFTCVPTEYLETDNYTFALAIGLGLEGLESDRMSIQWRHYPFSPQHTRKQLTKHSLAAAGGFLFAALALGPLGHFICNCYETNLLERAKTCLAKIAPDKKTHTLDLDSACLMMQKYVNTLKKEERVGTFAPKVSELIAWLGSCVNEENSHAERGTRASITSLNYSLTPEGKVEVCLTLQASPQLAEAFLKKIKQENSLLDRSREIIWKKEKPPHYNAQFYLK